MKKAVAFLLAFLIFVAPMTTSVKADVVIGDNDETIINENATILGRKLALLESFSDLALSGVTEFTITNTSDVDSYVDYLWTEINDAIDYLDSGEWTSDLNSELASKYFTNLVQYKDYINNRGDYLAHLLPSGNPTTNLLSTFFANNIFGKHSTLQSNLSLNTFRALSRINSSPSVSPDPDYSFYLDYLSSNTWGVNGVCSLLNYCIYSYTWQTTSISNNYSYVITEGTFMDNSALTDLRILNPTSINIVTQGNSYFVSYNMSMAPNNIVQLPHGNFNYAYRVTQNGNTCLCQTVANVNDLPSLTNTFSSMTECLSYLVQHFRYVNLTVDGVPWISIFDDVKPILDIDGFLKIYGNNQPTQYELQPNTKIDYDQLYQVIYNAIRDNLPINQGDINYYDSHDTIYSPTIINNYGEEEGDESDLIDTILDYAVIPKFDTAIAQPMRQALTNGVLIMNNSITNVIPDEILLILGACFFLLLFAVVINRMIK